ncbi:MAG: substrate-binding domain-containing protein, partial [archaeon]|nr:substrate-binding domain-containing protein [archaeon]
MFTRQKTHAMTLIALMMLAALAGCLGGDDTTDTDPVDTTDVTDPVDNGTDNTTVDDRIDVGTITCGPDGSISIAGSSTVYPLATAWAEYYQEACDGVTITVEGGGSGAGAGRVCANSAKGTAVDIGDMSRDWKSTEASRGDDGYTMSCLSGDTTLEARQIVVAYDGLSVVVKKGGAAQTCVEGMGGLTVDQLRWIFS